MPTSIAVVTPRRASQIAGIGYLVIFVLAVFANFFVLDHLVQTGDAAATARNIADSAATFRAGLVAFAIVFVVDVVVAWALFILFRDLSRDVSLLAAWFRLVYTVFLGVALILFFVALQLLSGDRYLDAFEAGQLDAHVLLAVDAFHYAWLIGLVCFGLHLLVIGYLVVSSGWTTPALGYVLMLAGAAYITDTIARAVLADYAEFESLFLTIVLIPSVVGELWFTVWLLRKGGTQPIPS
jgi:Domain of unknown function (DUF4386)